MRVLVLGSEGQLGSELRRVLVEHDMTTARHDEVDIAQIARVIDFARHARPDVIVNAAGYTDVDGCEKNKGLFAISGG